MKKKTKKEDPITDEIDEAKEEWAQIQAAWEMSDKKPGFNAWLRKQADRNDPIGDLATDMKQDNRWPKGRSPKIFFDHLNSKGVGFHVLDALTEAVCEFWDLNLNDPRPIQTLRNGRHPALAAGVAGIVGGAIIGVGVGVAKATVGVKAEETVGAR